VYSNAISFRYIFVSPMIRCMETAIHLFKNYPNKEKLTFVVVPHMKEGLNTSNDMCTSNQILRSTIDP
jgi:broad specificity phosphatase PhoE